MALLIFFLGLHQKLLISVCTVWSAVLGRMNYVWSRFKEAANEQIHS